MSQANGRARTVRAEHRNQWIAPFFDGGIAAARAAPECVMVVSTTKERRIG